MVSAPANQMQSFQDFAASEASRAAPTLWRRLLAPATAALLAILLVLAVVSLEPSRGGLDELVKAWGASYNLSTPASSDLSTPASSAPKIQEGRVAICLAGGAREFELNGPTLRRHLLNAYPNADVFISTPLTHNSYKLWFLAGVDNILAVRMRAQPPLPETEIERTVLTHDGSPNGLQGLLHYFQLVEGCEELIAAAERRFAVPYAWVLRTRTEGYWAAPPPPLASLDPGKLYTPPGSRYHGRNDRLAMGGRFVASAANRRYSMLPDLFTEGVKGLNSEGAFAGQLRLAGVPEGSANFSFCIITRRRFWWPLKNSSSGVASMTSSRTALNGAYCRPCTPLTRGGADSVAANERLDPHHGWLSDAANIEFCKADEPYQHNWEAVFDADVGPERAALRRRISNLTNRECVRLTGAFLAKVPFYEGPPVAVLCTLHASGPPTVLPSPVRLLPSRVVADATWPVLLARVSAASVVYSFGIGRNLTWESQVAASANARVHAFDATPFGYAWALKQPPEALANVTLHNWSLGPADGELLVRGVARKDKEVRAFTAAGQVSPPDSFRGEELRVPMKGLRSTMAALKHERLEVLKVSAEGLEVLKLLERWAEDVEEIPTCQFLIGLGGDPESEAGRAAEGRAVELLEQMGFHLVACTHSLTSAGCLFVNTDCL